MPVLPKGLSLKAPLKAPTISDSQVLAAPTVIVAVGPNPKRVGTARPCCTGRRHNQPPVMQPPATLPPAKQSQGLSATRETRHASVEDDARSFLHSRVPRSLVVVLPLQALLPE